MTELEQLAAGVAALEAQRATLGDAVVDLATAPLKARQTELRKQTPEAAPLPEVPAAAPQQLKQVTFLFSDIVGSTSMGQQLDPEDTHAIMDGALARFGAIVERRGGRVLRYMGDGLLAAFGMDASMEDDAERAVLSGLALIDDARTISAEVHRDYGLDGFNVRVGVNTGTVLLGGGVEGDNTAMGMPVNIAARMEQNAPPGGMRISVDTYRQIRGLFHVTEQPPLAVKGRDEPMLTYLVQGAMVKRFRMQTRGVQGLMTPLVGRDEPLGQLKDALRAQFEPAGTASMPPSDRLALITVVAEAGVGKSRLVDEFMRWAETETAPLLLTARAQPSTQLQTYGLLRNLVFAWFDIADTDSAAEARRKLTERVSALLSTHEDPALLAAHAPVLGQLLGLDFSEDVHVRGILQEGRQIRNRAFSTVARLLRSAGELPGHSTTLLVLDDLHWADDGSLDFVEYVIGANRDLPLLLIGLTRPHFFERRSQWGQRAPSPLRIELQALSAPDSDTLAAALLQRVADVPSQLRELLTQRAQGNPFYMEELVQMLREQGAIVEYKDNGTTRWRVLPELMLLTQVPPTLVGVLQSRLDRLSMPDKMALQAASIIGMQFWKSILAAVDVDSADSLDTLMRQGMVVPQSGGPVAQSPSLAEVLDFAFKHQILHQVTYDSILKRAKRQYHERTARWLVAMLGRGASDDLGAIAQHFERAADSANAAEYYARAAEQAVLLYDHALVVRQAGKALELGAAQSPELHWRALLARQRARRLQGDMAAQAIDLDAMETLAVATNDGHRRAIAALARAAAVSESGSPREALVAAQQALEFAQVAEASREALSCYSLMSRALQQLAQFVEAQQVTTKGLELARAARNRRLEGELIEHLGRIRISVGDASAGRVLLRQSSAIDRELGDRYGEASGLNNLGDSAFRLGQYAQARSDLSAANLVARSVGLRLLESITLINLAGVAHFEGANDDAMAKAQMAVELARAASNRDYEAYALYYLGLAQSGAQLPDQARQTLELSRQLFHDIEMPQMVAEVHAALARIALEAQEPEQALQHVEKVLEHLAAAGHLDGTEHPLLVRLNCHRVMRARDDPRAGAMLRAAAAELEVNAQRISDEPTRRDYLQSVPYHREILALSAEPG